MTVYGVSPRIGCPNSIWTASERCDAISVLHSAKKSIWTASEGDLCLASQETYGLNYVAVVLAYRIQTMDAIPMNPMSISTTCLRVSRSMMYRIVKDSKVAAWPVSRVAGMHPKNISQEASSVDQELPLHLWRSSLSQVWQHRGLSCSLAPGRITLFAFPFAALESNTSSSRSFCPGPQRLPATLQ